jgi:hypothetical protein
MLPDHLCRRDIPGLDEAILATEYALLECISLDDVLLAVSSRRLLGAQISGVWYVEAPSFCEKRLTQIRIRQQHSSQDFNKKSHNFKTQNDKVSDEVDHARVLGLHGRVTLTDIKRHYRERMLEYHPDRVASLGTKLKEVAEQETKKINAAYEFFTKKYNKNI